MPVPRAVPADAALVAVATPPDVEFLRRTDPALATTWRFAVRDALQPLMATGTVAGFTRAGSYLVRRRTDPASRPARGGARTGRITTSAQQEVPGEQQPARAAAAAHGRRRPRRWSPRRERRGPGARRRPGVRPRRERTLRRRVLVLGLRPEQGDAAPGGARGRGDPARREFRPAPSTRRPCSSGGTGSTGYDGHRHDDTGQQAWVEGTGTVARAADSAASTAPAGSWSSTRTAPGRRSRRATPSSSRSAATLPSRRCPASRGAAVDEPGGHQRQSRCPTRLVVLGGGVVALRDGDQACRGARRPRGHHRASSRTGCSAANEPFASELIADGVAGRRRRRPARDARTGSSAPSPAARSPSPSPTARR